MYVQKLQCYETQKIFAFDIELIGVFFFSLIRIQTAFNYLYEITFLLILKSNVSGYHPNTWQDLLIFFQGSDS